METWEWRNISLPCLTLILYDTTLYLHIKAILCPRRAENGRIFPCQWQHFMWHTIPLPYHTYAIHHTYGIPCPAMPYQASQSMATFYVDTPYFIVRYNLYHTTPYNAQWFNTIPYHVSQPVATFYVTTNLESPHTHTHTHFSVPSSSLNITKIISVKLNGKTDCYWWCAL